MKKAFGNDNSSLN